MRYRDIMTEARRAEPPSNGQIWYHGTDADFATFAAQPDSHLGFHFGTLAQAQRRGRRLIRATLTYHRPLRTIDAGDWSNPYRTWDVLNRALGGPRDWHLGPFFHRLIDAEVSRQDKLSLIRTQVEDAGYDAIIYKNRIEGTGDSIIVFYAEQIQMQQTDAI